MIKKLLKIITLFIIIAIFINLYVIGFSFRHIETIDAIHPMPKNTAAMALGAKVYSSGRLSYILKDRVDYSIQLYQDEKVDNLLFSGDHGSEHYDEVNTMMVYAITQGVSKSDIFLDHAGFSTYDSMVRAKEVFECDRLIIITQEFHLYRAVYIARRLGIDAMGIASNQHRYYASTDIKNDVREFFARIKDFFYVEILRPEPVYLGDVIPITGPAEATHDSY